MRCWLLTVLCGFVLMGLSLAQGEQKNLWNPVRLQLVGPLDSVRIDCGAAGETRLEIPLLSGERRDLQVPLVIEPSFVDSKVDVSWEGSGSVSWPSTGELNAPPYVAHSNLPLPVVPVAAPVLLLPAILGLVALALLLLFLRCKPGLMVAATVAGSALLLLQVGDVNPNTPGLVRIIEMGSEDMGSAGSWKVFDSALDAMPHQPGQSIRLQVKPASAPVTWLVTEQAGSLAIEARAGGALLRKQSTMKPGMLRLQKDQNALGNFESSWVREVSGQWTARGPWTLGLALPDPVPGGAQPPGWLVTGLPQGPEIWVARFAEGAGPRAAAVGASQTWLRKRLND